MLRRTTLLSLAIILGLGASLNSAPLFAQGGEAIECDEAAELFEVELDCTDSPPGDFSTGLTVTATLDAGLPYRYYDVQFADEFNGAGAYIPERHNSEAMVVQVLNGVFAFRVQGPGVVVDTQGTPLEKLTADPPIPLGVSPNAAGVQRNYTSAEPGFPCDVALADGRTVCLLAAEEFLDGSVFVRLEPGDKVYLPNDSTCFFCNTNRTLPDGTEDPTSPTPAELLIWSSTTGFNGEMEAAADQTPATPSAQGSSTIMAWAFNPGGRCN